MVVVSKYSIYLLRYRLFRFDQLQKQPGSFFIAAQTYFIYFDFDFDYLFIPKPHYGLM